MIKLTLLVFVCTIISTAYLQEIPTDLYQPPLSNENTGSQIWSLQNYQGQQRRVKPCPRRSSNNDAEEKWIPSYSSRITHPLYESTVLQPQALKNEDYKVTKATPTIESEHQKLPDRRSGNIDPLNEEDCIEKLESAHDASLNTSDAEYTALRIIEACMNKKQNNEFGSSRRSMSNSDDSDLLTSNNNFAQEPSADSSRNMGSQNIPEDRNANYLTTNLIDPEKGAGSSNSRGMENLLNNPRICYACSTATNPSCWEPDNRTTIKYCTKEKSCVTKSFGVKNSITMIRDCANTCEDSPVPGIEPKYKSCKLCHSDYCNAAISINRYNLVIVLIISIIKYTI